jgi:hypothetical protein
MIGGRSWRKYNPQLAPLRHPCCRNQITEITMKVTLLAAAMLAFAYGPVLAQTAPDAKKSAPAATPMPKAGAGEKVCRHKFPSGEARAWVCKSEEPCCAWDEISYVKCGSTVFKCL